MCLSVDFLIDGGFIECRRHWLVASSPRQQTTIHVRLPRCGAEESAMPQEASCTPGLLLAVERNCQSGQARSSV